MADGTLFECPATPERIDQCPATPDRLLCVKSPDSIVSATMMGSIENNSCNAPTNPAGAAAGTETNVGGRPTTKSPPPNCAICLGKCKDRCFTDTCQHLFCFKCLQEWSKVKAECPLCKKSFKIIIHNARGEDHYEEYLVPPPIISITESIPPLQPREPDFSHYLSRRNYGYPHRFDVFLSDLPRFSDNELFRNGFSATVQVHPTDNDALHSLFLQRAAIMSRVRQIPYTNEIVHHAGSMGQIWRRFIYEKKLYALPVVDITGRFRECSARFYRDNPAQTHRLMPWLNRDLVCLLRDTEHHVSYVLNILSDLLTIYNITSPEFRRRCQPYMGRRTSHFIHEFVNFARSPYDMIGYDREVSYAPYYEEVILSSSDLSTSSDSEERRRRRRRRRTEFTFATRSDFSRFFLTGTFDGFSSIPNFDITSDSGPINLTLESNEGSMAGNYSNEQQPQILGHHSVIQIDREAILSSSSDECEFVMEQKPPHLRTPELVTLNSDSDSDVVFVSETKTKLSSSSLLLNSKSDLNRKRKLSMGKLQMNGADSSLSSSESDDDDDDYFNPITERKPKLRKEDEKLPKDQISLNNNSNNNKSGETNAGASTSSGIGSVESRTNSVKKYYARPIRRARKTSSRRLMKSIFEDSSSESEEISYSESSSEDSDSDSSWSTEKNRHKHRRKSIRHSSSSKHHKSSNSKSKKKKSKKSRKKSSRKSKKSSRKQQRSKKYVFSSSSSTRSPSPRPVGRRNSDDNDDDVGDNETIHSFT